MGRGEFDRRLEMSTSKTVLVVLILQPWHDNMVAMYYQYFKTKLYLQKNASKF